MVVTGDSNFSRWREGSTAATPESELPSGVGGRQIAMHVANVLSRSPSYEICNFGIVPQLDNIVDSMILCLLHYAIDLD